MLSGCKFIFGFLSETVFAGRISRVPTNTSHHQRTQGKKQHPSSTSVSVLFVDCVFCWFIDRCDFVFTIFTIISRELASGFLSPTLIWSSSWRVQTVPPGQKVCPPEVFFYRVHIPCPLLLAPILLATALSPLQHFLPPLSLPCLPSASPEEFPTADDGD